MKHCLKCNKEIELNLKKCPYCGSKQPKEPKDNIEKMPEIIQTPNKILDTESLENTKEIKIKKIPLKVKSVTHHKEIKHQKETKRITSDTLISSFKLLIVIFLLIINFLLIIQVVDNEKKTASPSIKESNNIATKIEATVLGAWRSTNNGLFAFNDDKTFYWYDYYGDLTNNYYSGTYNYKKGIDALTEMGYTEEEFITTFGNDVKIENVYSINMIPNYVYKSNKDVTKEELGENESWWYILIIKEDSTAISYNKTLDLRYNLVKN